MFGLDNDFLKLALLGAGIAATGGLLAPAAAGLGGAGAAAGAAGTGSAGLLGLGAAEAGALGATDAALAAPTLGAVAPVMGAELAAPVAGQVATQAAAPVVEQGMQAGMFDTMNVGSNGLLGKGADALSTAGGYMKPVVTAMNAANMAKSLFGNAPQQQMPVAQSQMRSTPLNLDGIIQQGQQSQIQDMQNQQRRKQLMQQYAQRMGGM